MKRNQVRNQASTDLLAWLASRLSADERRWAAERLAVVEETAERPFRHLLWLYHGHDQVEGAYGQMYCSVRLRRADIVAEGADEGERMLARAASFAARTADFEDAPPEVLALHIQGARPSAVILGGVVEGPALVPGHPIAETPALPTPPSRSRTTRELTPKERALRGRIGAYTMLSRNDPREVTKAARKGFEGKFEREVDPEGVLDPAERARRAEMARKAHYARMSLASAQKRRK